MVFSSLFFLLIFLPLSLILYRLAPGRLRPLVLTAVSLFFYAFGEPVYVLLMLYSILLNYCMGQLMERYPAHKKQILIFTVTVDLLMLGIFKYAVFFWGLLSGMFGFQAELPKISLPVGISFYTFQALSYMIDLYRGKFKAQKDPVRFACYITMFPQLIAGPIVRYEELEAQLESPDVSSENLGRGAERFIQGLAKKVLLANAFGSLTAGFSAGAGSVLGAWLLTLGYTLQIYFDFSGYSDMAVGLGRMLGFSFRENFDHPYISASVTEFWRRWHISLGTWFREYVYIPLGGNRVSKIKHIRNILVVWLLTGLWHGAGWNFILWGLYYAALLLLEKFFLDRVKLPKTIRRLLMLLSVMIGWVFFFSDTLLQAEEVLTALVGLHVPGTDRNALWLLRSYGLRLLLGMLFSTPLPDSIYQKCGRGRTGLFFRGVLLILLFVLSLSALTVENYNPFLYFRF